MPCGGVFNATCWQYENPSIRKLLGQENSEHMKGILYTLQVASGNAESRISPVDRQSFGLIIQHIY